MAKIKSKLAKPKIEKPKTRKKNQSISEGESAALIHLDSYVRDRVLNNTRTRDVLEFEDSDECEICRALGLDPDLKI